MATPSRRWAAAAVLVVTLASLLILLERADREPPALPEAVGGTATIASPASAAPSERSRPSKRTPLDAPIPDRPDLVHAHSFELACRVVDRDGLPVGGATVFLAPIACALNTWPATTDATGRVAVRWRGRTSTMRMVVGVQRDGIRQTLREVTIRAGAPREVALLGEPRRGAPSHGASATDCSACHGDGPAPRGLFDDRFRIRERLHPDGTFGDLLMPRPDPEAGATDSFVWVDYAAGAPTPGIRSARDDPAATLERAKIQGRVADAVGRPVPGVTVAWGPRDHEPLERSRTEADGTFTLSDVPAGELQLFAGGGDLGSARMDLAVAGGSTTHADLVLDPGSRITGRVLGAEGAPHAGAVVEFVAEDGSWIDATTVQPDGSFTLADVPPRVGSLLLRPARVGDLPLAIEQGVRADGPGTVFDLRANSAASALRAAIARPDRAENAAFEVRVWQRDTGNGALMRRGRGSSSVGLDGLPAGFYRVEVGADACGWFDVGEHWLDGRSTFDLGIVTLPEPGAIEWQLPDDEAPEAIELYERRRGGDVRAEDPGAVTNGSQFLLPAGAWLCLWRDHEGEPVRATSFDVAPGGTVTVDLR